MKAWQRMSRMSRAVIVACALLLLYWWFSPLHVDSLLATATSMTFSPTDDYSRAGRANSTVTFDSRHHPDEFAQLKHPSNGLKRPSYGFILKAHTAEGAAPSSYTVDVKSLWVIPWRLTYHPYHGRLDYSCFPVEFIAYLPHPDYLLINEAIGFKFPESVIPTTLEYRRVGSWERFYMQRPPFER